MTGFGCRMYVNLQTSYMKWICNGIYLISLPSYALKWAPLKLLVDGIVRLVILEPLSENDAGKLKKLISLQIKIHVERLQGYILHPKTGVSIH